MPACPKDFRSFDSLVVSDGTTPTPISANVQLTEGFSIDGLQEDFRAAVVTLNRGEVVCVRKGDRENPSISFTVQQCAFVEQTVDGIPSPIEWVMKLGDFAPGISTLSSGDLWAVNLVFTIAADATDDGPHVVTIEEFHPTIAFAEGEPNTYTVSGEVYGDITFA